jgi:hypothetical protein
MILQYFRKNLKSLKLTAVTLSVSIQSVTMAKVNQLMPSIDLKTGLMVREFQLLLSNKG